MAPDELLNLVRCSTAVARDMATDNAAVARLVDVLDTFASRHDAAAALLTLCDRFASVQADLRRSLMPKLYSQL